MQKITGGKKTTGAKIVSKGAAFLLAGMLVFGTGTQVAEAAVHPSVIIEAQQEETKEQRENEVRCIQAYLASTDYTGNRYFNNDKIRKVMELSGLLNAFDPDFYTYTNTTPNEVLSLDIEGIYANYVNAVHSEEPNAFDTFIAENLNNKPAMDATMQLSTGVISASLKQQIAEIFVNKIRQTSDVITDYPYVILENGTIYIVAGINNGYQIFTVDGMSMPGVYETAKDLEDRYTMIIENLKGNSNEYPNAISYNGINRETGESVWFSFGDDDIKPLMERGMDMTEKLANDPTIGVEFNYPDYLQFPSYEELMMFKGHGFSAEMLQALQTAPITGMYIYSELDLGLNY